MGRHCVIVGCNSKNSANIPLAKFPDDEVRRNQWIDFVIKTSKNYNFTPNTASRLCHKHFDPDLIHGKALKPYAIPTKRSSSKEKQHMKHRKVLRSCNKDEKQSALDDRFENLIKNEQDLERTVFIIRKEAPNWLCHKSGLDFLLYQTDMSSNIPRIKHGINITSSNLQLKIFAKDQLLDSNLIESDINHQFEFLSKELILELCTYLETSKYETVLSVKKTNLLSPLHETKLIENVKLLLHGETSICRFCFASSAETNMGTLKYINHETKQHFKELTNKSVVPKFGDRICDSCLKLIQDAAKVRNAVWQAEKLLHKFAEHFPNLPPDYSGKIMDGSTKNAKTSTNEKLQAQTMQQNNFTENAVENIIDYDPDATAEESLGEDETTEDFHKETSIYNQESIECAKCRLEFSDEDQLNLHLTETVCDNQNVSWTEQEGYSISVDDSGKKEFECKKCNKKFATKHTLDYHFQRSSMHSTPILDSKCNFCGTFLYDQATLKRHIAMVHDNNKIPCEICGREFNAYHMNLHLKRHKKSENTCTYCDKKFESNFRLQDHVRLKHTHEKPYKCSYCDKSLSTRALIVQHMSKDHPDIPKHFLCTMCGKGFWAKQALASHQKNCSKIDTTKDITVSLKPKSKKTHKSQSIERPYSCRICSKNFAVKLQLEDHERKHVTDEINICLDCGASFSRKEGLKVHQQTIHLKEFEFFCQFCKKGFVKLAAMKQHENIHTNNQKYSCTMCPKFFNRANTLNVHIESVHKNKRYRCKWCLITGTVKEIRKFSSFLQHIKKFHEQEYDSDEDLSEQIVMNEETIGVATENTIINYVNQE